MAIIALCLVGIKPGPASGESHLPEVSCLACLVVDDSGRTVLARKAGVPLPNASTTKMMTALLTVKEADLDSETVVSATAAGVPGGRLGLVAGERWSVEELLYALLVASSNDAAVALAEHVSGDEVSFVRSMNAHAERLGLEATSFATSHGLDAPGHASSAWDLARLAELVLEDEALAAIVGTKDITIESSERAAAIENTNLLLESYPGALGVKTGFTALAGNVLVAAAERGGRRLIAVVMHSVDPFADASLLLDHGFAELRRAILLPKDTVQSEVVFDGAGATTVTAALPVRGPQLKSSVVVRFEISPEVALPIERGDRIGQLVVLSDSRVQLGSVPATSSATLPARETDWRRDALTQTLEALGRWWDG